MSSSSGFSGAGSASAQADSFAALFDDATVAKRKTYRVGQPVEGKVVQITSSSVFVELGDRTQAFVEILEVTNAEGEVTVKEGDTLRARVLSVSDDTGIRLGRSMGKGGADPEHLRAAKESGAPIEGKVTGVNKGGLEVDLGGGVRAFCPLSQLGSRFVQDVQSFIGQSLEFKVTEIKDGGRGVVVSRKAVVEEAAQEAKARVLATLQKGQLVKGTVTAVREFGVFVDLGGLEALVPRSELSHDRSVNTSSLAPGDAVEAQVLDIKTDEKGDTKVSLSIKATLAAPERAPVQGTGVGAIVDGVVTRIESYGLFVQIDGTDGREGRGLIPNAELGVPRGTDLRKQFPEGTKLRAKVVESAEGKLKLSVRAALSHAERAEYEADKDKGRAPRSLGTLGELLKGFGTQAAAPAKGKNKR